MPDIVIDNHGSVVILIGASEAGEQWLSDNLADDHMTFGRTGHVVEPRYVGDILIGASEAGLAIS